MNKRPITNPRTVISGLHDKIRNEPEMLLEIHGFWNGVIHEWKFNRMTDTNGRHLISITHVTTDLESGEREGEGGDIDPYNKRAIDDMNFYMNEDILNNRDLIITYVWETKPLYDCRNDDKKTPSTRCYDRRAKAAAINLSRNIKSALANPNTTLGSKRLASDYNDLMNYYPLNKNSFGNITINKINQYIRILQKL